MPRKSSVSIAIFLALSAVAPLRAELPPSIQGQLTSEAEKYDSAMKEYDDKYALLVKLDRDRYLTVLNTARRREEGAKRTKGVAAIDEDIKALEAKMLGEEPPADLPADLATYRTRCVSAPERAAKAVESARRGTRDRYLKWLSGMADVARRAKNKELAEAVAKEEKRVHADASDEEETDKEESDEDESDESESSSDA